VSRAEAGGSERPRWNDSKPFSKPAESRGGYQGKESAGAKAGAGGYKSREDHKHASTPDKPKRNARYW
jgi:hypothetical protein